MRLSGKVHHRPWLILLKQLRHQLRVANVAMHKHMSPIFFQRIQSMQITRIRERVQIDDWLI